MTTAHTPGPWHVAEGHEHSEDCPLNVWSSDGRIVAAIVGQGLNLLDAPTAEGAANARLIAAAPRLLAALAVAEEFMSGFEDDETQEGMAAKMAQIRAAIDAATQEG